MGESARRAGRTHASYCALVQRVHTHGCWKPLRSTNESARKAANMGVGHDMPRGEPQILTNLVSVGGQREARRYAGAIASTLNGLPLPPTILSGAAITTAPVAGSRSRWVRLASPNFRAIVLRLQTSRATPGSMK